MFASPSSLNLWHKAFLNYGPRVGLHVLYMTVNYRIRSCCHLYRSFFLYTYPRMFAPNIASTEMHSGPGERIAGLLPLEVAFKPCWKGNLVEKQAIFIVLHGGLLWVSWLQLSLTASNGIPLQSSWWWHLIKTRVIMPSFPPLPTLFVFEVVFSETTFQIHYLNWVFVFG